jgi:putative oxidoreductase
MKDSAELLGRLLLVFMFFLSGVGKIAGYAGTQAYMVSQGVPGFLLPLVIVLEIAAPLAILAGWETRLVAAALAVFSVLAAVLFHFDPADQAQMISLQKNFAIAGGFLLLVVHGPGRYSLDARSGAR